ncbi:MAG: hypothetical protein HF314_07120 [Ignavibacteria bacterium]|jgi:hypothetical protein|nr:hypothetical protein [Ignavibacteria bacterium]MCU7502825.1 hypothetical protein [Ignavibacteria bacterium]MCU7515681.1 hypothetical protein [Ignavibacteria bacterium]
MKNLTYVIIYFVFSASLVLNGCSAPLKQAEDHSVLKAGTTSGKISFLVPWVNNQTTIQCVVEEVDSAGYKLNNISFYTDSIKNSYLIFSQRGRNFPIAVFPMRDNSGNLMTIWESGVTYNFRVYNFSNGRVSNVLEGYSQSYPELFYENKVSEDLSILITNVDLVKNRKTKEKEILPVSATLYRWKNNKYISVPNIPWNKRFSSGK